MTLEPRGVAFISHAPARTVRLRNALCCARLTLGDDGVAQAVGRNILTTRNELAPRES